jgi:hypothetical protein
MSACSECLSTGGEACERCYIFHYLLPHLEKEFERLRVPVTPVVIPIPRPDPPPFFNVARFERDLVHAFAGEPNPQPSIFSLQMRLKATVSFRKALEKTIETVDKEIAALRKEK